MGVRKNQHKLKKAEKARFVAAVKKMKSDTTAAYNYDKYVTTHASAFTASVNPAHMGPAFFPWHRYFLLSFERDLAEADKALGGDGSLTLPYWDWTHDNGNEPKQQRGSLWRDDLMGGYGAPVTSGPFRQGEWTETGTTNPIKRALGRKALDGNAVGTLPTKDEVKDALALQGFDSNPWGPSSTGASLAAPKAPHISGTTGGSLAPGIYRVWVTLLNAVPGETRPSPETTICLGGGCSPANANNAIQVKGPTGPAEASGYQIYVTAANGAAGSGMLQGGLRALGGTETIIAVTPGAGLPTLNSTSSFRNVSEGWRPISGTSSGPLIHNRVHMWVAGSMAPGTSPNDPIFFLHHCNVDRLWATWQFRNPGQNYPEVGAPSAHNLLDTMLFVGLSATSIRPIDMLNHQALGYSYDTDSKKMSINISP